MRPGIDNRAAETSPPAEPSATATVSRRSRSSVPITRADSTISALSIEAAWCMAQYAAVNALTIVSLVIGVVFLVLGAELLVKGAATIASKLGIAPVIIGLTVVAFGTSAPELAVSVSPRSAATRTSRSATSSAATSATSC
jgi:hypothetical protein